MAKYYFTSNEKESCYTLDYFLEQLGEGFNELTVYPAKMVIGQPVF